MKDNIFTFEKLYKAYLDCRENKRKSMSALKFEYDLERNLFELQKELLNKEYRPGRSICFVVKEPSPREIFAANFRDRVVHHLLIREMEEAGERVFIFDTFSCRKGKGTHLAVKRLKTFIRRITKNYKKKAFYLQLDISGFFMSMEHDILYSLFEKLALKQNKSPKWNKDILWLARTVIYHKPVNNYIIKGNPSLFTLIPPRKSLFGSPKGRGLPIGNYSSQFFANLYLNELDQFVKRELKRKYYLRYVDDFIILGYNKEKLKALEKKIYSFLKEKLSLELNFKKTKLERISNGIDFLGYITAPEHTLIRKRVVSRLKGDLGKRALPSINSYYGHFRHADSFNLRKSIFESLNGIFKTDKNYSSLKAK